MAMVRALHTATYPNNYDKKILALKEQIQRIIGGIEVLEKLKEEITTPNEKE